MRSNLLANLAVLAGVFTGGLMIPAHATVMAAASATPTSASKESATATLRALAPDAMLSVATAKVTARLKQDDNPAARSAIPMDEFMETTILPLFDFSHMTRLAIARDWKLASAEQQASLIAEFRTLLVRTYSVALANYRDEVIEYKPLALAPTDTDVTVRSTVKKPGVERMTIDYDMEKMADGWKVYDIRIAGISLAINYRSTFAGIIRDGGIDELIRYLANRNRMARSGLGSDDSEARGLILLYGIVPSLMGGPR